MKDIDELMNDILSLRNPVIVSDDCELVKPVMKKENSEDIEENQHSFRPSMNNSLKDEMETEIDILNDRLDRMKSVQFNEQNDIFYIMKDSKEYLDLKKERDCIRSYYEDTLKSNHYYGY